MTGQNVEDPQGFEDFYELLDYLGSFEEASGVVLKRPEPPDEVQEGETWRRGEEEVIAWVDTFYEPASAPWYERRRHQIFPCSLWFGPCLLEGYDPAAPLFFADTSWLQIDGRVRSIIAAFDARDGRLVMLPGATAHRIWMTRYQGDERTNEQIWALDRGRLAHYKKTGQTTPTRLDELPGRLVNQWYVPTQGGSKR